MKSASLIALLIVAVSVTGTAFASAPLYYVLEVKGDNYYATPHRMMSLDECRRLALHHHGPHGGSLECMEHTAICRTDTNGRILPGQSCFPDQFR
jgi:hypothetical protein